MKPLLLLALLALVAGPAQAAEESDWIRVAVGGRTLLFRPDGTGRTEGPPATDADAASRPTPGGKWAVSYRDQALYLADKDGGNERRVSPEDMKIGHWDLSPDGERIAFMGGPGSFEGSQIHVMDRDGANVRKLTDAVHGASFPRFGPDGRIAYSLHRQRLGKSMPIDLMIVDARDPNAKPKALVENIIATGFAWSPDAKLIAYGQPGLLIFHEVESGKTRQVTLANIDRQFKDWGLSVMCWSPDSRAIACRLVFWGGRQDNGPKLFGDEEVFVIPRGGGGEMVYRGGTRASD